ncbi:hypothetical protein PQX77_003671 [Marasmius sp. AFHP31]|nr:hypothetical protein PQX77_003671 [Marasmius sp. AFHP31]
MINLQIPESPTFPIPVLTPDDLLRYRTLGPIYTSDTRSEVREAFEKACYTLASYDQTIRDLKNQLSSLTGKREALQERILPISSLFAPVRRLPTEILQQILVLATVGPGEGGNMFGVYSSWVSQSLRISAVGTSPSLRHLVLNAHDPALAQHILRNRGLSMDSLTIRYEHYMNAQPFSLDPKSRFKHLVFQFGPDGSLEHSLQLLSQCADIIEFLSYQSLPDFNYLNGLRDATHLPLAITTPIEPIHCAKVSELIVNLLSYNGIYPHLKDIFEALTLPSSRRLDIYGFCSPRHDGFTGNWPRKSFENFLRRSQCTLTDITFGGLPLSVTEITSTLRLTPSLERLTIMEFGTRDTTGIARETIPITESDIRTVTKTLLSSVTLSDPDTRPDETSHGLFLPRLQFLELRVHRHFDADEEFVGLVKSRWYHPRLESIRPLAFQHRSLRAATLCITGRDGDEAIYRPLKSCDSEGMQIVVRSGGKNII